MLKDLSDYINRQSIVYDQEKTQTLGYNIENNLTEDTCGGCVSVMNCL